MNKQILFAFFCLILASVLCSADELVPVRIFGDTVRSLPSNSDCESAPRAEGKAAETTPFTRGSSRSLR